MTATDERHLIKKYANRKLYDTTTSQYITLDGVGELLKQGREIEVIDRESGRDITALVLSQVVATEEKREDVPAGSRTERGQALLDYVRNALNAPASFVGGEMERRRSELESMIDAAIERALTRLSIPSRRDLERISSRLDELARRIDTLS